MGGDYPGSAAPAAPAAAGRVAGSEEPFVDSRGGERTALATRATVAAGSSGALSD